MGVEEYLRLVIEASPRLLQEVFESPSVKVHAVVERAISLGIPAIYDVLAVRARETAGKTILNAYVLPAGKNCLGVLEGRPVLLSVPAGQVIGMTVQLPTFTGGEETVTVAEGVLAAASAEVDPETV